MSALLFIVLGFLNPFWPWIAGAFAIFFLVDVFNGVRLARAHALVEGGPTVAKSVARIAVWSILIRTAGLIVGLLLSLGWRTLTNASF